MKKNKIYCSIILFVFLTSGIIPFISLEGVNNSNSLNTVISSKLFLDQNNDKIDDELSLILKKTNSPIVDFVLEYSNPIKPIEKQRLTNMGVSILGESWDLGRRVHISANRKILYDLAEIPEIAYITTSEKRMIMIAIEGNDFSDLQNLIEYPNAEIFWNVGCALIPFYSGVENDITNLGSFSMIVDSTDIFLKPNSIPDTSDGLSISTLANANTINASALWSLGYDGSGIKIGNIDTGINDAHVDFAGRIAAAQSFILTIYGYPSDDTSTTDTDGHGSHTSGIIAGDGTGNPSYIGIAPDCDIYFARVGTSATLPSVIAALDWLLTQGVEVVNFSYGGTDSTGLDIAEIAFRNAVRNNEVLCSISAGNEGNGGYYTANTPGTTDDVITVGNANDWNNPPTIVSSSSRGPTADNHMKPDLMAPGYNIMSCRHDNDGYISKSGTSMAAPQITGSIALLIEACKANGIDYNPGLLKGALMKTATLITPVSSSNILYQGRGVANVGAAWNYILNSVKEGTTPIIGACNPVQEPMYYWTSLLQGQITEQYVTCVSPFTSDLSLEVSGNVAAFVTINEVPQEFTSIAKVTFRIPIDASLGSYTGLFTFKYKTYTLDTVAIDLTVTTSNGHRMLLNYRTTDWSSDHMYGQYKEFTEDILNNEYIISEQNITLDNSILEDYEAVWLPDPFNYKYPQSDSGDYSTVITNPNWASGEIEALTNYVSNGGSVFLCFLGQLNHTSEDVLIYTNISAVNEFTDLYGIHVRDTVWTGSSTVDVDTVTNHPLTVGVDTITHYGGSLALSGDAVQLTELYSGSEYATCASTQTSSGGRVIVLTTNFVLDTDGYLDLYSSGTQNNQFGKNLIRWATAKHRIEKVSSIEDNGVITLTYNYLHGPGADFGGYVETPTAGQLDLNWTEISTNVWQTKYYSSEVGTHYYHPECGATGIDDFDYIVLYSTQTTTPPDPTTPPTSSPTPTTTPTTEETGIILLSIILGVFGLASFIVILRKRKLD